MTTIYHLTTPEAWDETSRLGEYRAPSLDREGFIHASTIDQVVASANRYYSNCMGIVLLEIEVEKLKPELIWESSSHSEHPFPHLYGPLNLDAVTQVVFWQKVGKSDFLWPPSPRAEIVDS